MMRKSSKPWIVYLGTFPPRECGIATFTEDLSNSFGKLFGSNVESKIVAMNREGEKIGYGPKVIYEINENLIEDYKQAAIYLNSKTQVKLVNIQHEFGIFGGRWGDYLLEFLRTIKKPVVVTLHTVLPNPDPELKKSMTEMADLSQCLIVMSQTSQDILVSDYGLNKENIRIIPHGLHTVPLTDPETRKSKFNLQGKLVIATFGLISKNKGIEYVLDSMPGLVTEFPNLKFLIVGATHPTVLKNEGENYRNYLEEKILRLRLEDHVEFINKYLSLPELLDILQATDVYMATPLDPNQAVSGTLTYALGTGRPVVTTAFAQAREIITPDIGRVVAMRSSSEIKNSLQELLKDKSLRLTMGRRAYFLTRPMLWENVALIYMQVYSYLIPEIRAEQKNIPRIKLDHMRRMTDNFGLYQFAELSKPLPEFGYTVDDNARGLMAICDYLAQRKGNRKVLSLARIYLNFIAFVQKPDGYFHNYVDQNRHIDHKWNNRENMEDPSSRALLALAIASTSNLPKDLKIKAHQMFRLSLRQGVKFHHLRSNSFYIKALAIWCANYGANHEKNILLQHTSLLLESYKKNSRPDWNWFEPQLTYCNAVIPEALLYAYLTTNQLEFLSIAQKSIDFLIQVTFKDHVYVPIGQDGWYPRGGKRALFDQQPEDACSMVQALKTMYGVTGQQKYAILMNRAFYWFLGNNLLHQFMYNELTGGCFDGLKQSSINFNEGAESTVSYLIARLTLGLNFFQKRVLATEHSGSGIAQSAI